MKTYFISNGTSIKIGRATHPHKRIKVFQTASPVKLVLLTTFEGNREAEFHRIFAEYREQGEWFNLKGFTFPLWLLTQVDRDDFVGDIAQEVKEDRHFPYFELKTRDGFTIL